VAVARRHRAAQGADIEDEVVARALPPVAHHDVSGVGGRLRRCWWHHWLQSCEGDRRAWSQQPDGVRSEAVGRPRVVAAAEDDRRRREDRPEVGGRRGTEGEQGASIVIANRREGPVGTTKSEREVDHALHAIGYRDGERDAETAGEHYEVEIDIDGVSVIARRLLEVSPVVVNLALRLGREDLRAELAPPRRARQRRTRHAGIEEAQRLAGQMRIGREVPGQVGFDVSCVPRDGLDDAGPERRRDDRRIRKEPQRPHPRHHPERELEAARPVDAEPAWVRAQPSIEVRHELFSVASIAGESVSLSETHGPLVAVQLPHDLAVPDRPAVEWVEPAPVHERRAPSVHRVEMPVDRHSKMQPAMAQDLEFSLADAIRRGDDRARRLGRQPGHQLSTRSALGLQLAHLRRRPLSGRISDDSLQLAPARESSTAHALETLGERLSPAESQLAHVGVEQSPDLHVDTRAP
jgi:hypothetical protein